MVRTGIALMLFCTVMVASAFAMPHEECTDESSKSGSDCARCHTLTIDDASKLLAGVGEVKGIKQAVVRGLFEVTVENNGKQAVAYVDYAKKYLLPGPIFSLETKKIVNGTVVPPKPLQSAKVNINSIPLSNSIVFGNPSGKKKLIVFTDPECPFCAKLHMELVKLVYMEPDLAIYVKMFPLKMHPAAYDKARVILGGDSVYLLNKAFAGEPLPAVTDKDARGPVDESIKLGESLGITATPTVVLPDGTVMTGFREAAEIKKMLDVK